MGLCIRLYRLPDEVMRQDWAELAEMQKRLLDDQAENDFERWQNNVRHSWQTP